MVRPRAATGSRTIASWQAAESHRRQPARATEIDELAWIVNRLCRSMAWSSLLSTLIGGVPPLVTNHGLARTLPPGLRGQGRAGPPPGRHGRSSAITAGVMVSAGTRVCAAFYMHRRGAGTGF